MRRVEIVDESGRARRVLGELGRLTPDSVEPIFGVGLVDGDGCTRASLSLSEMGPNLTFEAGGNAVIELAVTDSGPDTLQVGPYLFLADGYGWPVIRWRAHPDGDVEHFGATFGGPVSPLRGRRALLRGWLRHLRSRRHRWV